ncbi:MAG: hypothetical protein MZW92_30810 [Comamonadaceae bacterium]|nr:hypothetical protein [Comamonadaceae bacterium]
MHPAAARHAVRAARGARRVADELKAMPPHAEIDADTINARPRGRRQVRRRGVLRRSTCRGDERGLHARQGHARGDARPRASRRPTPSTSKAAGRR